jgi:hypothetical protein
MATKKAAAAPAAAPVKKAVKKAAPAPKKTDIVEDKVKGTLTIDPEFSAKVVALREQGLKWDEIADRMETTTGKALLAHGWVSLPAKEKIKGTDAEKQAAIVRLRDDELMSWGQIMIRVGMNLGTVQRLYQEATGVSPRGLRVGRGGRYPNDDGGEPAPAKKAAAKKAAPPAPAKTKVAATGKKAPADMTLEELKERLEGAQILVTRGDKTQTVKVKTVKTLKDGVIDLVDATNGGSRTIKVADISKIGRVTAATKN